MSASGRLPPPRHATRATPSSGRRGSASPLLFKLGQEGKGAVLLSFFNTFSRRCAPRPPGWVHRSRTFIAVARTSCTGRCREDRAWILIQAGAGSAQILLWPGSGVWKRCSALGIEGERVTNLKTRCPKRHALEDGARAPAAARSC